jgi:hypothetical protein
MLRRPGQAKGDVAAGKIPDSFWGKSKLLHLWNDPAQQPSEPGTFAHFRPQFGFGHVRRNSDAIRKPSRNHVLQQRPNIGFGLVLRPVERIVFEKSPFLSQGTMQAEIRAFIHMAQDDPIGLKPETQQALENPLDIRASFGVYFKSGSSRCSRGCGGFNEIYRRLYEGLLESDFDYSGSNLWDRISHFFQAIRKLGDEMSAGSIRGSAKQPVIGCIVPASMVAGRGDYLHAAGYRQFM